MKIPNLQYLERREGEIIKNYTKITKAKKKLGFSIDFNLKQGLKNNNRLVFNKL